jgi:hypothetical protein
MSPRSKGLSSTGGNQVPPLVFGASFPLPKGTHISLHIYNGTEHGHPPHGGSPPHGWFRNLGWQPDILLHLIPDPTRIAAPRKLNLFPNLRSFSRTWLLYGSTGSTTEPKSWVEAHTAGTTSLPKERYNAGLAPTCTSLSHKHATTPSNTRRRCCPLRTHSFGDVIIIRSPLHTVVSIRSLPVGESCSKQTTSSLRTNPPP